MPRILALMHRDLVPPESMAGYSDREMLPWKTEYDVTVTLKELGHDVQPLGVYDDFDELHHAVREFKPSIVFNLLEEFAGISAFEQHVVSYLELIRQPYTGCNPRGLALAHDKVLAKKLLAYHGVSVPRFQEYPHGRIPTENIDLKFPILVKSSTEDASLGISQASVVRGTRALQDRVKFIHEHCESGAIAEEYIEGRELYVGIVGNVQMQTLPIWEMVFKKLPAGTHNIASARAKWDLEYQKRSGIVTQPAQQLSGIAQRRILRTCKNVYRALGLSGYARIDLRYTPDGTPYVLEANPNPNISYGEDFAESAETAGVSYEALLEKIIRLGRQWLKFP